MVKFKIGFTIDAKTLFGMLSQFLPVGDLSVEEVAPVPDTKLAERFIAIHTPKNDTLVSKRTGKTYYKSKRKRSIPNKIDVTRGVNAIIMGGLADGKIHRQVLLRELAGKAGFSESGLGSRLQRLIEHGYIVRTSVGYYRATTEGLRAYIGEPAHVQGAA